MESIIEDYNSNLPLLEICRKYKIGKKKLYSLLVSKGLKLRPNKKKLKPFPYTKNQIIDGVTILDEDYHFDGERWNIRFKCSCGEIDYKRPSFIEKPLVFTSCKKCSKKSAYPQQRKKRINNYDKNGINFSWLNSIKNNLKRGVVDVRNLDCLIDCEDLYETFLKQNGKCALSGEPLVVILATKKESNASIDRIDSNLGYTKDNIQWVLKDINKMKNDFNQQHFINLCCKVSKLHDNFEPSLSNDVKVDKKVQRLEGEESNQ